MKKLLVVALLMSTSAQAAEVDGGPLFELLFKNMALGWACQKQFGGLAHYQAARLIAVSTLSLFVDEAQAVLSVDQQDKIDRSHKLDSFKKLTDEYCQGTEIEYLFQINVEKIKLKAAVGMK